MLNKKRNNPIGVFDSGLGGLTVVKELMRQLPGEDIVYYGDTARLPYGTKSKESIIRFSKDNVNVLIKNNVKMIIVACNSSSSYALSSLKKEFSLPIVGVISAGAKKAALKTQNKKVGVIATSATIKSQEYLKAIKKEDSDIKVLSSACSLFVPIVEEGWTNKQIAIDVAKQYLKIFKSKRIDTLVLGCTHYPLLKSVLRKVMGRNVFLVDSATEVASQVKEMLNSTNQNNISKTKPKHKFLISDRPQEFQKQAKIFLGRDIKIKLI
ncbi:MAG: glutamate racemase [Candidatus Zapsychrus exili]|nr:glutamate racemase [Candidatus Zapsychrus exili]